MVTVSEASSAGRAAVLMFHRFQDPARGSEGMPPDRLRWLLAYLRKRRYHILDLEELAQALVTGSTIRARSVALTFDDGYADQFEMALPILTEFDAPATVFLTTGFVDGQLWLWWDQVEHLISNTLLSVLAVRIADQDVRYPTATLQERAHAIEAIAQRCKQISDEERRAFLQLLSQATEVELPLRPPQRYQPIRWDQVRAAERFGVRAGPGTVSHPILSRADTARSDWEIRESWRRVQEEVQRPMPVFCFPNGTLEDFSVRELNSLRNAGLSFAVSTVRGYASPGASKSPVPGILTLPRFSGETTTPELVRIVSGVQRWVEGAMNRLGRPR